MGFQLEKIFYGIFSWVELVKSLTLVYYLLFFYYDVWLFEEYTTFIRNDSYIVIISIYSAGFTSTKNKSRKTIKWNKKWERKMH